MMEVMHIQRNCADFQGSQDAMQVDRLNVSDFFCANFKSTCHDSKIGAPGRRPRLLQIAHGLGNSGKLEIDAIKHAHHRIFQSKFGRSFLNLSRLFCSSNKIEAICLNALNAWHSASLNLLHTLFQCFPARHLQ